MESLERRPNLKDNYRDVFSGAYFFIWKVYLPASHIMEIELDYFQPSDNKPEVVYFYPHRTYCQTHSDSIGHEILVHQPIDLRSDRTQ